MNKSYTKKYQLFTTGEMIDRINSNQIAICVVPNNFYDVGI